MNLTDYQQQAQATDQLPAGDPNAVIVPLLGMAGEVGSLLAEYKKYLRDKDAHVLFPKQVAEELGDILWYLANTATKFDLDLAAIAADNLAKTRDRWPPPGHPDRYHLLDDDFPADEQLPRSFSATIVDGAPREVAHATPQAPLGTGHRRGRGWRPRDRHRRGDRRLRLGVRPPPSVPRGCHHGRLPRPEDDPPAHRRAGGCGTDSARLGGSHPRWLPRLS